MHRLLVVGLTAVAALVLSSSALAWSWPTEGDVLRPFTLGNDVYASGQHRGVDVAGSDGSPVVAPASGVVSFAGSLPTYGRGVTIVTPDGYAVTLVHLGSITVAKGDSVDEGRPVGIVGWSGDAEHGVPSVHLGVRIAAQSEGYVDPLGLLPPRQVVPVAPPAPTPSPAPAAAPAPAPAPAATPAPVAPPADASSVPPQPPVTVASAPSAPEPRVQAPEPPRAETADALTVSTAPGTGPSVAPFRIGGAPEPRTLRPERTGESPRLQMHAAGPPSPSTERGAEQAVDASARSRASSNVPRATPAPSARLAAIGDLRATHASAAHAGRAGSAVPPGGVVAADSRTANLGDPTAASSLARVPVGTVARPTVSVADPRRHAVAVAGDGGGPKPGVIAAAVALLLLALGAAAKTARRIGADGAVLRHDADLLRQLDAAHRSRLHDRRGGRVRSTSAAARP